MEKLSRRQKDDPDIGPIWQWVQDGERPRGEALAASSPATRHYWLNWNLLVLKNGVLYRKFEKQNGTGEYLQFIVPRQMQEEILYQMHESVLSGHLGKHCTAERLLQGFYWFGV